MDQQRKKILVLDDASPYHDYIRKLAEPDLIVESATKIQNAYWMYVNDPGAYCLVILDFNLEGNRSRSNFDGIDLASVVEVIARNRGLQTPWLVGMTAASDELVQCFLNVSTRAPVLAVIAKGSGANHLVEQLTLLFSALRDNDPSKFTKLTHRPKRFAPKIILDDKTLNQLSWIYKSRGKKHFEVLARSIATTEAFSTYRTLEFSALAPGYSGSEVLSVDASRAGDGAETRTFVIKLCKDKTQASHKLDNEVQNYLNHAFAIRDYVPLLTGPFQLRGWKFIVYEFIFVQGRGVSTFADYLDGAIKDAPHVDVFEMGFSRRHSDFIFDRILKEWHESHEYSEQEPNTRFFYADWAPHFVKTATERITAVYAEIKPNLKEDEVRMDLGLTPQPLVFANPLRVLAKLLNVDEKDYEYPLSAGVVHGDLHSGNILRSLTFNTGDPVEWRLIDFANVWPAAHLAQDGARLECDIKFNHYHRSLRPRFTLEVELAKWLDGFLAHRLGEVLDLSEWANEWAAAPNADKCVRIQIGDIRKTTIRRLEDRAPRNREYSQYTDYTVSLLVQSLMFVGYTENPIKTLHAWLAACLAATLIVNYSKDQADRRIGHDILGAKPVARL